MCKLLKTTRFRIPKASTILRSVKTRSRTSVWDGKTNSVLVALVAFTKSVVGTATVIVALCVSPPLLLDADDTFRVIFVHADSASFVAACGGQKTASPNLAPWTPSENVASTSIVLPPSAPLITGTGVPPGVSVECLLPRLPEKKTVFVLNFPYVCPEPVLEK